MVVVIIIMAETLINDADKYSAGPVLGIIIIIIIMLTNVNILSPVLALGIKLGCGTNDLNQYVSHFIVYWVSIIMINDHDHDD